MAYGGGSIFKNGIHEQVINNLKGFEIVAFGGIEPNPHFETLMKAVAVIKEQNIDFILAVGGGSVIDGVKFISAAVHFDGNPMEILQKRIFSIHSFEKVNTVRDIKNIFGKWFAFWAILYIEKTGLKEITSSEYEKSDKNFIVYTEDNILQFPIPSN